MIYRFKDKEYTEDQLAEIASIKEVAVEELLAKNPDIEKIEEEQDGGKTQVVAEGAAPAATGTPAVEDTESQSGSTSSDGQPTDPPWKPSKFTADGKVDLKYYEDLPLMSVERVEFDKWKEQGLKEDKNKFANVPTAVTPYSEIDAKYNNVKEVQDEVANQLKYAVGDVNKISTQENLIQDIDLVTNDIINNDKIIQKEVSKTQNRLKLYSEQLQKEIVDKFNIDAQAIAEEIAAKYDLSNADEQQKAEEEYNKVYQMRLRQANRELDKASEQYKKFEDEKLNEMYNSEIFSNRINLIQDEINKQATPLVKEWKLNNLDGFGSLLKYVEGTVFEQLIGGVEEMGKSFEASKISLKQLAIQDVQKNLNAARDARNGQGIKDDETVYVFPDGSIDFEKSNIPRPVTIQEGSATPRQPKYNLKGEIETRKEGAFGLVDSKPMKFSEYKKMQEKKKEKFATDIKVNLENINEFDNVLSLIEQPELFDEDGATMKDVFGVVLRMAPQVTTTIGGAALAPATGGSSAVAASMLIYANEYGNNYWSAIQEGLAKDLKRQPTNAEIVDALINDKYQTQAESAGWAAVSTLLEQGTALKGAGALKKVRNSMQNVSKKLGYDDLKQMFVKTGKNSFNDMLRGGGQKLITGGKNFITEFLTEGGQGITNQAVVNQALGKKAFDDLDPKGILEEGTAGGIMSIVIPGAGAMYRGAVRSANYIQNTAYKVSIGKVKAEQFDKFFADANQALTDLKKNGKISEESYAMQAKDLADLKNNAKKIPKSFSPQATQKALDLMLERDQLKTKMLTQDEAFSEPDKKRVTEINNELLELQFNEDAKLKAQITKKNIEGQMDQVVSAKGLQLPNESRVEIFNDANAQEIADKYGVSVESLLESGDTEGGYIAEKGVILMSEKAANSVLKHEGLHNYWDIGLNKKGNESLVFAMADVLMEKMRNTNPKIAEAVEKQLDLYKKDPDYPIQKVAEEVITYYGQLKDQGFFKTKENKPILTQFIDYVKTILESLGFKNIVINEQNIDSIIDNYVSNIEGKGLSARERRIARGQFEVAPELKARGEDVIARETVVVPEQELAMAAAKKLTPEQTTQVDEDITSLQQEIKENEEVAKRMGKEPIPTPKQQRLEAKVKEDIKPTVDSFVESQTKRLYDPIPANIKQDIDRNTFKQTMRNDIETMVFNEYEVGKQDIEKFITSRGFLRANSLAGRLGIPTVEEGVTADVTEVKGLAADEAAPEVTTKAKPTPKSKIPKEFPEIITPQIKEEVETAALEIFESETPDVSDKQFKNFLTDTFRGKLTKPVKDALGTGKNYEFTIKKLAPKMKELLPAQWFVRLESQTKPENRLFTKPPKRLTKQEDIDAAMQDDKVYVENTAQGVNLYEFKDFTPKQLIDYLLAPAISPETGKRSGLRGTRKTTVAEGVVDVLGKDVTPQTVKRVEKTKDKAAEISRKVQRDPNILFAKKGIKASIDSIVEATGSKPIQQGKESVDNIIEFFTEGDGLDIFSNFLFQPVTKTGKFQFIQSSVLSNAGNLLSRAAKKGFPFIGNYNKGLADTKKKLIKENPKMSDAKAQVEAEKIMADTKKALDEGRIFETSKLQERVRQALEGKKKRFTDDQIKKMNLAIDGQTRGKLDKNLNNIKDINEGKDLLLDLFREAYVKNPSNMNMLAFMAYHHNSNTNPFRNFATVLGEEQDISTRPYEEHTLPFGEFANTMLAALASDDSTWKGFKKWAKENYFQEVIDYTGTRGILDQATRSLAKDGKTVLPKWASKSEMHPLLKQHVEEALQGKRSWDDVVSADIRKYNEYSSSKGYVNPNKIGRLGKTDAERYNVVVPKNLSNDPNVIALQNKLIYQQLIGEIDAKSAKQSIDAYVKQTGNQPSLANTQQQANNITSSEVQDSGVMLVESKSMDMETLLSKAATLDEALRIARDPNAPVKKIRVFDFDDTLATSNNIVFANKDGKTIELNAEEFAKRGLQLKEDGWVMDFSDFNKVTDGGRGPLFEVAKTIKEARGNKDLFVLTARAPESADAIYEFLKAEGLEFRRENIVGLGNSTGEAKANWIVDKAAEGYNDFYFADDAYQNVRAVQDALDVIDVKSKVQQAKMQESKSLSEDFNKLIEETTGIGAEKVFSRAKAKILGEKKGKYKFWIPPSAEDFVGLMYPLLAKGKKGEQQMEFIKKSLMDPWAKAMANLQQDRLNLMQDFKQLKKSLNVPKKLKKTNETGFTNEQAVRVYLYTAMGHDVPGLSKRDLKELNDIVANDPELKLFSEQVLMITKGDGYIKPSQDWLAGTITTDLIELLNTTKRQKYLENWQQNADVIFSENNLNKLEALYGPKYREALENMLARMKSGKNRMTGGNRLSNRVLDYINGSIGTIMFFNTRSAILQTISSINYINWSFNNPIQAGKAFANQPQYWKDFMMLMNSDYLRDRRNGQRINISETEILDAAKTSKNKAKGAISYILSKGYLPTQMMDSFAIASGGATYYRNRINSLLKETDAEGNKVYTKKQAEELALKEWQELAEENQQSSRVDKISQQQASDLGRIVLAFANTPMQYARIQKRAFQDLANGRGDAKENISKIIYYGFVQNMIFNALQQAVFALGFGDDKEDDEKKNEKYFNTINGMLDSTLRGLGVGGQAVSVSKNFLLDLYERSQRSRPEYVDSMWKLLQFSPPVSSKISKLRQAAWQFDSKKRREKIFEKGFSLDNPAYEAFAKVVSATTNIPLDRVLQKFNNIEAAFAEDTDWWQTIAMLGGWPEWQIKPKDKKRDKKNKSIIIDDGGVSARSSGTSAKKPIIIID